MHARLARQLLVAATLIATESLMAIETTVPPSTFKLVFGKVVSGDVSSLALSDGTTLRLSRFTVPNVSFDPVWFNLEANLPSIPTTLNFKIQSRSLTIGTYSQTLQLFDWQNRLFDPNTMVTGTMSKTFTTMTCNTFGSVSKYFQASDRRVKALVRAKAVGLTPIFLWQVEHDRAWFAVGSGP